MAQFRGWDTVPCRICLTKGVRKLITINKTETCVECRSSPCTKCGTLTISKKQKCFACSKPAGYKRSKAKKIEPRAVRTGDE